VIAKKIHEPATGLAECGLQHIAWKNIADVQTSMIRLGARPGSGSGDSPLAPKMAWWASKKKSLNASKGY